MSTRQDLQQRLFPNGIPRLWCPTISIFDGPGSFDAAGMEEHLTHLSTHVRGVLVPGSTGEGWEMSDEQIVQLLDIVIPAAQRLGIHVLVGILKTDTYSVLQAIERLAAILERQNVVGITVCPPQGAQLGQQQIMAGLKEVLKLGWPTALYQLPQVTQNEMAPETVAQLAAEYANFIMFKDTSGDDRVASARVDLGGVFMVRGAEKGGYSRWLRSVGGPYDGFLLSTANTFGELSRLIELCDAGKQTEADEVSDSISAIVSAAFAAASKFPIGNPFTNANKALIHLFRYGRHFRDYPAPMLISGQRLPLDLLEEIFEHVVFF